MVQNVTHMKLILVLKRNNEDYFKKIVEKEKELDDVKIKQLNNRVF
jgi:hypothetical protein